MTVSLPQSLKEWFSAANLFAAGLFCLFLGMFFGTKFIAVGQVIIIISLVMAFVEGGRQTLRWRELGSSARWLAIYLFASVVSILANLPDITDPLEHLGKLRYFVMVLLLLIIPGLVRDNLEVKWRRDSLVLAWLVPLILAVIVGMIAWATGEHPFLGEAVVNIRRLSGLYGQVMTFANVLQFSVVTLAILAISPGLWGKITRVPYWVLVVTLLLAGAGLYLTYTRGAMLGVVAGFTVYAVMRSYKFLILVVLIGIAGAAFASFDGARYLEVKSSIRVNQWRAAALSFVERPVFGLGYRNFELKSAELKERYGFEKDLVRIRGKKPRLIYFNSHAHNNILESFASIGVFGGIAFLGFCYAWVREMRRSRYGLLFVPLIGAFFVAGLFENTFYDSEVLNCILLIYLMSQWALSREKREGASDLCESTGLVNDLTGSGSPVTGLGPPVRRRV
jgi:O-antigen ligase